MKPRVYLETTIPSYLTAPPSRNPKRLERQRITRLWWEGRRGDFDLVISQSVVNECGGGDPTRAAERLKAIAGLPLLVPTSEASALASRLAAGLGLPPRALEDANHLALAAVYGIEYLLTWNCTHLANDSLQRRMVRLCAESARRAPTVCTPEWLLPKDI